MMRGRKLTVLVAVAIAVGVPCLAQDAAKMEQGKAVFTEQKCKVCHSVAGVGSAKGALDGVGSKLTAEEIKRWLVSPKEMAAKTKTTRKPPMKAFTDLPAADLDALVAYLQSLKSK